MRLRLILAAAMLACFATSARAQSYSAPVFGGVTVKNGSGTTTAGISSAGAITGTSASISGAISGSVTSGTAVSGTSASGYGAQFTSGAFGVTGASTSSSGAYVGVAGSSASATGFGVNGSNSNGGFGGYFSSTAFPALGAKGGLSVYPVAGGSASASITDAGVITGTSVNLGPFGVTAAGVATATGVVTNPFQTPTNTATWTNGCPVANCGPGSTTNYYSTDWLQGATVQGAPYAEWLATDGLYDNTGQTDGQKVTRYIGGVQGPLGGTLWTINSDVVRNGTPNGSPSGSVGSSSPGTPGAIPSGNGTIGYELDYTNWDQDTWGGPNGSFTVGMYLHNQGSYKSWAGLYLDSTPENNYPANTITAASWSATGGIYTLTGASIAAGGTGYSQACVGYAQILTGGTRNGPATITITAVNGGSGTGAVTGIAWGTPGAGYTAVPAAFGTTGGTTSACAGTGLTVTPTYTQGVATYTTASAHNISVGDTITISGASPSGYNGTFYAEIGTTGSTIKIARASNPGTYVSGGSYPLYHSYAWADGIFLNGAYVASDNAFIEATSAAWGLQTSGQHIADVYANSVAQTALNIGGTHSQYDIYAGDSPPVSLKLAGNNATTAISLSGTTPIGANFTGVNSANSILLGATTPGALLTTGTNSSYALGVNSTTPVGLNINGTISNDGVLVQGTVTNNGYMQTAGAVFGYQDIGAASVSFYGNATGADAFQVNGAYTDAGVSIVANVPKGIDIRAAHSTANIDMSNSTSATAIKMLNGSATCFNAAADCLLHTGSALAYQPSGTTVASIGDTGVLTGTGLTLPIGGSGITVNAAASGNAQSSQNINLTSTSGTGTSLSGTIVQDSFGNVIVRTPSSSGAVTLEHGATVILSAASTGVGINTQSQADALQVANGKIYTSGTTPTIGSCGTSPSISGTDVDGKITVGTGGVTSCVVTLGGTYSQAARAVTLTPANATASSGAATGAYVSAITTSSWTLTGTALSGAAYYYHMQ